MLKRVAIRSIIFAICLYTWSEHSKLWVDDSIPEFANPAKKYGRQWRLLTIQNFFVHLVVNALFLVGEAFAPGNFGIFCMISFSVCSNKLISTCLAKKLGNILHYGISFGTTWVVFTVFWPLYFINQELILSKKVEAFYPQWLNIVEHGFIGPFALINCLLEKRTGGRYSYSAALGMYSNGHLYFHLFGPRFKSYFSYLRLELRFLDFTHLRSYRKFIFSKFRSDFCSFEKVLTVVLPLTIGLCGLTAIFGVRMNDTKYSKVKTHWFLSILSKSFQLSWFFNSWFCAQHKFSSS